MKTCSKCKQEKELTEFYRGKNQCKNCKRELNRKYQQENKERLIEQQKKYYQENKEKIADKRRKYRQENKEKIAESQKKYRQENKEKIAENKRKYYQENKEYDDSKKRKAREEKQEISKIFKEVSGKWRANEVNFLIDNFTSMTNLQIALHLKRTSCSVRQKIIRLRKQGVL